MLRPWYCVLLFLLSFDVLQINSPFHITQALKINLIDRHSPKSPLHRPNVSNDIIMEELIQISHQRVGFLSNTNHHFNVTQRPNQNFVIRPKMKWQTWRYIVQIGLGTFDDPEPFKKYFLVVDTASDLLWVQCEGCVKCFHQVDPLYPASKSKTYKLLNCENCPLGTQCVHGGCTLTSSYSGGASVEAIMAMENFVFEDDNGRYLGIPGVLFGCGININNFAEGAYQQNQISGILGMSYGDYSIVRKPQFLPITAGKFSYCLQALSSQGQGRQATQMYLRFGADIIEVPGMQSTPMPRQTFRSLYYLNLQDLGVMEKRLGIPSEVFRVKPDNSGGCVIDSGCSISYIVTEAYKVFEAAVISAVESMNNNVRRVHPKMDLKICYEVYKEPWIINLPSIQFYFENGATMDILGPQVFYMTQSSRNLAMACLAIYESRPEFKGLTIIGAYQQVNQRIIFDTQDGVLKFGEANCDTAN